MSLPPALLQRLAQRGLVQKPKSKNVSSRDQHNQSTENEEVIAEDYDEMESADPSQYEPEVGRKNTEENFWAERMRMRMGDMASTWNGYKGCPNKYNIWHKCTLFCVNRWAEGHPEPSRDYLRRYKRLKKKYPLPKGWTEIYDPGCGCFFFANATDNVVSWLPPTHPKSQVTKSAATLRRQMEEPAVEGASDGDSGSDASDDGDSDGETAESRHHREVDEIITSSLRGGRRSPPAPVAADFPSLQESITAARKPKNRDLERTLSRQSRREREGGRYQSSRRKGGRDEGALDPMDPSAYSDIPRGKWSDGLNGAQDRKKPAEERKEPAPSSPAARTQRYSDDEGDHSNDAGAEGGGGRGERRRRRSRSRSRSHSRSSDEEHDDYD